MGNLCDSARGEADGGTNNSGAKSEQKGEEYPMEEVKSLSIEEVKLLQQTFEMCPSNSSEVPIDEVFPFIRSNEEVRDILGFPTLSEREVDPIENGLRRANGKMLTLEQLIQYFDKEKGKQDVIQSSLTPL